MSELRHPHRAAGDSAAPRVGRFRSIVAFVVLAGSFAYLFTARVPWDDFLATTTALEWRSAPRILVGQLAFIALGGLALWLLLGRRVVSLRTLLAAYWRCVAIGFWTPAALGELSLAWWLRPHGVPVQQGLALMTIDKLVTVVALGILATPMLGRLLRAIAQAPYRTAAAVVLVVSAMTFVALIVARLRRAGGAVPPGLGAAQAYCRALYAIASSSPARLAGNLAITLLRLALGAAVLGWSMAAFDPVSRTSFADLLVLSSAARLLAFALPSPNGLGIYEVSLVEFLSPHTIPAPVVLSGVLLSRIVALLAIGVVLPLTGLPVPARQRPSDSALGSS